MNIQLVIFDMAGTTVHDEDFVNLCLQNALRAAGVEVTRNEVNEVMGMPKPVAIRILMEQKLTSEQVTDQYNEELYQRFLNEMLEFYRHDARVREVEGASEVFQTLQHAGIKVAIDTGFARPIAAAIIEKLGWERNGLIDVSVASDEVEKGRPHADLALRAASLLGISDMACTAKVGDTPADLGEGHAAGCGLNIGVLSGASTRAELEIHPHTHLLSSIREIPALLGIQKQS
jgi:phosphonatase-like hydrolase